ncbi:MAG: HD domain-containing protein [Acidilobaceae archaeon]|nr:HD domain-containing protein [Acidilobaceae archaeon]MCX8165308.1 HD domain-containing protein [Acidilobaceae archaeon]MDW7973734.1 HD domain-containing protein [Sulfolobales archaeon]
MTQELLGAYEHRTIVQDSIHGVIPLNVAEYEILQTPFLRRIHDIKQLGLANLVFPSATHSRLEHSLGVMHIAWRMGRRAVEASMRSSDVCAAIFERCDQSSFASFLQVVRLAGILHDIGHLPFSHMSEEAVEAILSYSELSPGGEYEKLHELYTQTFISKLANILGDEHEDLELYLQATREALFGRDGRGRGIARDIGLKEEALGLVKRIMSNYIVDADRLDYLVRDATFTGVVYGFIDIDRMVESLEVRVKGGRLLMEFNPKASQAVEDMFDARYKMYRTLYFHHKLGAIKLAVKRAFDYIREEWEEVRPRGLDLSLAEVLRAEKLAELIAEGRFFFDDSDAMSMIKALRRSRSEGGRRWASALLHERSLLPVSLIKRPEELFNRLGKWEVSMEEELERIILGERFNGVWERAAKRAGFSTEEVKADGDVQRIYDREAFKEAAFSSLYVKSLIDVASAPMVFVYAFSENEEVQRRLYKERRSVRELFQEELAEELKASIRA